MLALLFDNHRQIDRRWDEVMSRVHLFLVPKDDCMDRRLCHVSASPEILVSGPAAKVLEVLSFGILLVAFAKS